MRPYRRKLDTDTYRYTTKKNPLEEMDSEYGFSEDCGPDTEIKEREEMKVSRQPPLSVLSVNIVARNLLRSFPEHELAVKIRCRFDSCK